MKFTLSWPMLGRRRYEAVMWYLFAQLIGLHRIMMLPGRRPSALVPKSFSLRFARPLPIRFLRKRLNRTHSQDLKREFVEELIYPAIQANCIYEVPRFSLPELAVCHSDVIL